MCNQVTATPNNSTLIHTMVLQTDLISYVFGISEGCGVSKMVLTGIWSGIRCRGAWTLKSLGQPASLCSVRRTAAQAGAALRPAKLRLAWMPSSPSNFSQPLLMTTNGIWWSGLSESDFLSQCLAQVREWHCTTYCNPHKIVPWRLSIH